MPIQKIACDRSIGILTFDLGSLYEVKVVHSSNVNISKIVIDRANIIIAVRYEVAYGLFRLAYLDLSLTYILQLNLVVGTV